MAHLMEIKLEVKQDSPLSIADALIEREESRLPDDAYTEILVRERIRQIGLALLNHVDSDITVEKCITEMMENNESWLKEQQIQCCEGCGHFDTCRGADDESTI